LQRHWDKLPECFPNFVLDVFKLGRIIHGIILLNDCVVRAGFTPAHNHNHEGQPQGIATTLGQPQVIAPTTSFSIKFDHHYIINPKRAIARDCPYMSLFRQ
jgi:hypothetical protein